MTTSMYCLYVGVDYTYIDVNALAQGIKSFLASRFGIKPLLGLEPMAPIRPQLLVSHTNHSATETSMYVCMYVYMYVCVSVFMCVFMSVFIYVYMLLFILNFVPIST